MYAGMKDDQTAFSPKTDKGDPRSAKQGIENEVVRSLIVQVFCQDTSSEKVSMSLSLRQRPDQEGEYDLPEGCCKSRPQMGQFCAVLVWMADRRGCSR